MSDEAPKSRRGGRRPGAGRKRKGHAAPSQLSDIDLKAALAAPVPDSIETIAQRKARVAIDSLVKRMIHDPSEATRVQACNALLDRAYGKPSVAVGGDPLLPFFGSAPVRETAPEIRDEARKYAVLAIEVLERVARDGQTAAAVTAAKSLLDRGLGTVAVAKMQDELADLRRLGKKEQAEQAAEQAGTGRFATPPAPTALKRTLQ